MLFSRFFTSFSFSRELLLVALFGLFLSASTQMLYSHLALFLRYDLNASLQNLGAIDGTVEFFSYFMRVFAGALSDYLHNRKLFLVIGCSIAVLVKPVFSFANSIVTVAISEVIERFGCGIQASPRDAFIADLSPRDRMGSSFGFCKTLKTAGGVLGASLAVLIMYLSGNSYRLLFFISAIPAFLALLCIVRIGQKNPSLNRVSSCSSHFDNPFQKKYLKSLDARFWSLIFLAFLCELAHFGESLLTIRSSQIFSQTFSGVTSICAAFGQVVFAYFMGLAADNFSKFRLIRINLILLIVAYIVMFFAKSIIIFWIGIFIFYGQFAVIQLLFLALISLNVNSQLRGTAVGIFYVVIGISYMITTYVCGTLCKNIGYEAAFIYVSLVAAVALTIIGFVKSGKYEKEYEG